MNAATSPAITRGAPEGGAGSILQRVRERPFWVVQAGVVGVTALHTGLEALGLMEHHSGPVAALGHLPVLLYLLPVVYAGLTYGFEGGLRTGAAIALLSTPNLVLWHRDEWVWAGEAVFIASVVFVGAAIAIPVERERRERERAQEARRRAELAEHRIRLLKDVTATLSCPTDLDAALADVVTRTVRELRLAGAELAPAGEAPVRADGAAVVRVPATDGDRVLLVERVRPLDEGERRLLDAIAGQIGVALDNARMRRDHDAALHAYARGVTAAQEDERRRIARELHDVVTHGLLVVRRDLEREDPDPDATHRAHDRLGELVTVLRRFSHELRPGVLEPLGLAPAIEWLTSGVQESSEVRIVTEIDGTPIRLARDRELALYRITEEALRNALEHAGATTVEVALGFSADEVTLSVCDDGDGFDPDATTDRGGTPRGLGLVGMRERAAACGAEIEIRSRPGSGTGVSVRLPLQAEAHTPSPAKSG